MAKSKKKAAKPAKKVAAKKPVSKKVSKPAPKKVKPATKKPVKAVAKKAVKPVKKISKPVKKKISKPTVKKIIAKVKKAAAKPIVKKSTPVKKAVVKPIAKKVAPAKSVIVAPKVSKPIVIKPTKGKNSSSKTRYSDNELEEFRQLILEKSDAAKKELKYLQEQISRTGENTADETENKYSSVDDGGSSMEREYLNQMASRQRLYIDHLDKALVRIQNKTYGICRVTGKLIEKDRLRAVPHATLSMEAKLMQGHPQHTPVN